MTAFSMSAARWVCRMLLLAVFVVASAALFTAPTLFGESYGALALGVAFGFGVWWVAVFGPPKWADGLGAQKRKGKK